MCNNKNTFCEAEYIHFEISAKNFSFNPPSTAKNCMHRERVGSIGPHTTLLVEFNKKSFC